MKKYALGVLLVSLLNMEAMASPATLRDAHSLWFNLARSYEAKGRVVTIVAFEINVPRVMLMITANATDAIYHVYYPMYAPGLQKSSLRIDGFVCDDSSLEIHGKVHDLFENLWNGAPEKPPKGLDGWTIRVETRRNGIDRSKQTWYSSNFPSGDIEKAIVEIVNHVEALEGP